MTASPATGPAVPRLTFARLLAFVAVALPVVAALRFSMSTIDLAYVIRAGNIMLDTGEVLRRDLFTFTVFGEPWLNQQWGADIVFALLHRAGSWELIHLVQAALAGVILGLVFLSCRARGADLRTAAWLTIASLLLAFHALPPRPQLLGFTLFALSLWLIARRERHSWGLWVIPLLTLAWTNLHGSFFLAPVLLVLAALEDVRERRPDRVRTALLSAAACLAVTFVNPYGGQVWNYVVSLSTDPELRATILEWRPPNPTNLLGFAFVVSVLVAGWIAIRNRRELGWVRLAALALFFLIGASAVRGIIWWALATPVVLANVVRVRRLRADRPSPINTAIAAALVALGVLFLPWFRPTFTGTANSVTATDGLLAHAPIAYSSRVGDLVRPGTRLFVAQIWASWFEYSLPRYPVMVDPRIELFIGEIWDDFDAISNAEPGWQDVVDRWGIEVLVLSEEQQSDLIPVVEADPGWRLVYEDADGALFVRADG
jgi:hypothetical protein